MKAELRAGRWSSVDKNPFLVIFFRRQRPWKNSAVILVECSRTKVGGFSDMSYEMGFSNP